MLLAIDVGNTNSVFAVFDGKNLIGQWRLSTIAHRTADEYGVWLNQILMQQGLSDAKFDGAIISTVVPESQFALTTMCKQYISVQPLIVGLDSVKLDMPIKIDKPEEVGADRLVNAIEAWKRYKQPLIIVDFGTATTFDVVSVNGEYVGGVIAPGVNLSLDALHKAAAKLPNVRVARPAKVVGTSTVTAMQSGVFYGYLSMIDGLVARIKAERGEDSKTIATGGLATLYAPHSTTIEETTNDLTIYGLLEIYESNKGDMVIPA